MPENSVIAMTLGRPPLVAYRTLKLAPEALDDENITATALYHARQQTPAKVHVVLQTGRIGFVMGRIINDMYLSEDEGRHLSTAEEVKTLMSLEEEIEDVERECPPHLKNSNNRQSTIISNRCASACLYHLSADMTSSLRTLRLRILLYRPALSMALKRLQENGQTPFADSDDLRTAFRHRQQMSCLNSAYRQIDLCFLTLHGPSDAPWLRRSCQSARCYFDEAALLIPCSHQICVTACQFYWRARSST